MSKNFKFFFYLFFFEIIAEFYAVKSVKLNSFCQPRKPGKIQNSFKHIKRIQELKKIHSFLAIRKN